LPVILLFGCRRTRGLGACSQRQQIGDVYGRIATDVTIHIRGIVGAEEVQLGVAALVQRAPTCVDEQVVQDQDVPCAALGLGAVLDQVIELVVGKDTVVTADRVGKTSS
jgi:hypothetical protein